jgi:NarL family two-component system response regulator LiaR
LTKMVKIMLVDDHNMVRLGLRNYLMLESDIVIVGEAGNGIEALQKLEQGFSEGSPDLILMDLIMPEMDGIEATAKIIQKYPKMKIMVLSSFLEEEKVIKALEAGADSYVMKTVSADELVTAIRGVMQGKPIMNSEVSIALAKGLRLRTALGTDEGFTPREKEVLLHIAEGKSNKEIAENLHIGIKTVKTHVSNLLMKCELEDRTQLAIYAHRNGWVGNKRE